MSKTATFIREVGNEEGWAYNDCRLYRTNDEFGYIVVSSVPEDDPEPNSLFVLLSFAIYGLDVTKQHTAAFAALEGGECELSAGDALGVLPGSGRYDEVLERAGYEVL